MILGCVQSENKTARSVGAGAISASAKFVTIMCKMLFSVDGLRVLNSQSGKGLFFAEPFYFIKQKMIDFV